MKRPKPAHTPQRLQDLRGATITCLYCDQPKPLAGATRYRAHWVCVGCTTKLQTLKEPTK